MNRDGFRDARAFGNQLNKGKWLCIDLCKDNIRLLRVPQRFRYKESNRTLLLAGEQHTARVGRDKVLLLMCSFVVMAIG